MVYWVIIKWKAHSFVLESYFNSFDSICSVSKNKKIKNKELRKVLELKIKLKIISNIKYALALCAKFYFTYVVSRSDAASIVVCSN